MEISIMVHANIERSTIEWLKVGHMKKTRLCNTNKIVERQLWLGVS